jgi:hypothetical protein
MIAVPSILEEVAVSRPHSSPAWTLTVGAALFALYVMTHPHGAAREVETVDEAVHSMAVESTWVLSHLIGLAAVLLLGAGVWMLLRSGWLRDLPRARQAAWLLFAGTLGAALELAPHILVASETTELAAGGATPVTDLHLFFQATLLPVYGLGVAALAVTGYRRIAHPLACVLGAVGGIALIVVGPLLLVTKEAGFGVIFMPGAGTFLFLLAAGLRLTRAGVHRPELAVS